MIDLFAGCGGMTAGFASQGFESRLAVEWDEAASATFAANFGEHVYCGDITNLPESLIPEVDIVIGGPPCQGFSSVGLDFCGKSSHACATARLRAGRAG